MVLARNLTPRSVRKGTAGLPICGSSLALAQNAAIKVELHGLEDIPMDLWTQALVRGKTEGIEVLLLRKPILDIISHSSNEQMLFKKLRLLIEKTLLNSAADYVNLGTLLLELRQDLRQSHLMNQKSRQDSLYLMQMLAEESLYIGSQKFVDFPKEITLTGSSHLTAQGSSSLRDFTVQTGDVVLSKSTGFGSSSFIALSMDHPHIYSHSTPVFISKAGELLSPEAEIEDGVKLRRMSKDYVEGSKTRMYIYRYQGADNSVQEKVEAGAQNLVAEMYQRTDGDPFNKAAYKYDFSMTPGHANERGLFCSSVAYEMYVRAGLHGDANPYNPEVWSPVSQAREDLLNALNMNTDRVPAPGDLELNKEFYLVGARIDVTKLGQDRIEMAVMDAFLSELGRNRESLMRISEALKTVSNNPIDKESLKNMASLDLLPKAISSRISMIDKAPDAINLKQLVFFAFLNEYMTPKLRMALVAQVESLVQQGKVPGPIELRKMARAQGAIFASELSTFEKKIRYLHPAISCKEIL